VPPAWSRPLVCLALKKGACGMGDVDVSALSLATDFGQSLWPGKYSAVDRALMSSLQVALRRAKGRPNLVSAPRKSATNSPTCRAVAPHPARTEAAPPVAAQKARSELLPALEAQAMQVVTQTRRGGAGPQPEHAELPDTLFFFAWDSPTLLARCLPSASKRLS
jgi:hypothetical protein